MDHGTASTGATEGRVLVTGADGLIGRATVAALLAAGRSVTGLDIAWTAPTEADRSVTGDATEPDPVAEALREVDAVVHLAAIPHPDLAPAYDVFRINTAATFNVLSQASEQGIRRAVIASSINAFGVPMNRHPVQPAYFPLDERLPVDHDDWYSLSKFVDEHTARMAHRRWGIDVIAIRFPLVRPADALRTASVALPSRGDFARLAREGWAYLDLRDAVGVIAAALTADVTGAEVILAAAADILPDLPTEDLLDRYAPGVPRRRAFPGRSGLVDLTRARQLIGWAPRHSIHQSDAPTAPYAPAGSAA